MSYLLINFVFYSMSRENRVTVAYTPYRVGIYSYRFTMSRNKIIIFATLVFAFTIWYSFYDFFVGIINEAS